MNSNMSTDRTRISWSVSELLCIRSSQERMKLLSSTSHHISHGFSCDWSYVRFTSSSQATHGAAVIEKIAYLMCFLPHPSTREEHPFPLQHMDGWWRDSSMSISAFLCMSTIQSSNPRKRRKGVAIEIWFLFMSLAAFSWHGHRSR